MLGCTSRTDGAESRSDGMVSVSIHGVNHSAEPFQFAVVDPRDEKNSGGGEHIGPFAAGGIVCCFSLPNKWRAGATVKIHAKYWVKTAGKNDITEIEKEHLVEVPPYASGKAGELWVMRTPDGGIEVVSSDLQPDHPEWPGKVKGWPVPSREFMLERWEINRRQAEIYVETHKKSISELSHATESVLRRKWEFDKQHRKDEIKAFHGPQDPLYKQYLEARHAEGLRRSESRLEEIMKAKP